MIQIDDVRRIVSGHSLVAAVEQVPRCHVRLETAFLYPDGSSVDLYLVQEKTAPVLPPSRLSDLAQTMCWLSDVQVRPWLSKNRQALVELVLQNHGVEQQGGALEFRIDDPEKDLLPGVVQLGQACVRVADLIFTRRSPLVLQFGEQVEEFLADSGLSYEPGPELPGRYGKVVHLDFLVSGRRSRSAVLALSSGNTSQAHTLANEVFRKWYDLDCPERPENRVTVFDDNFDVYRDDDLARLREKSDVIALSDRNTLIDLLAA